MRNQRSLSWIVLSGLLILLLASLAVGCNSVPAYLASLTPPAVTPTITPQPATHTQTASASATPSVPPSTPTAILASDTPIPSPSQTSTPTAFVFAVIGDYGSGNGNEAAVADLVMSWQPEIILTLGDNNYPIGSPDTIDENIGQFYHTYISPYTGTYGDGAEVNRFFPVIGNHDVMWELGRPYLDYFSLPGNERYYDFVWGPVHFFALNNETNEPDGVGRSSLQAQWLQEQMAATTSPWQIVTMHYPPFSSAYHGSTDWAQWPYAAWGADAVLAGHDHVYERLIVDGIPYLTNGLGGGAIYSFEDILSESVMRYNAGYGALWGQASEDQLTFRFMSITGEVIDVFEISK